MSPARWFKSNENAAGAARIAVHRLRRRYAESVREEIAALVDDPGEIESEIRHLLEAVERA